MSSWDAISTRARLSSRSGAETGFLGLPATRKRPNNRLPRVAFVRFDISKSDSKGSLTFFSLPRWFDSLHVFSHERFPAALRVGVGVTERPGSLIGLRLGKEWSLRTASSRGARLRWASCWRRLADGIGGAGGALADHLRLGAWGERVAARHLTRCGYRILTRNYRAGGAEIDIIALDGDTLVFVEVKTRRTRDYGEAAEAVNARKREKIKRAAALFVQREGTDQRAVRFDVLTLTGTGPRADLGIIKGAF